MSDMFLEIAREASLVGATFTFVYLLGILIKSNKALQDYLIGVLFLCNTIIQGSAYYLLQFPNLESNHFGHYLYIPFNFLFGPALYFGIMHVFKHDYRPRPRAVLAFVPGLFILFLWPIIQFIQPELFNRHPLAFFEDRRTGWLEIMFTLGFVYDVLFYAVIFSRISILFRFENLRQEKSARALLGFVAGIVVVSINSISVYFTNSAANLFGSSALITVMIVFFFLFNQKFPEFFTELEGAIQKARYRTSKLGGLNLDEIGSKLDRLIVNEEVYRDENLNLAGLARKLDLSSQQLSEYLNKHMGSNFAQYINRFRAEKAADILLAEPEAGILSVAYQVGFNSKSTFHSAFTARYGMSPSKFLKERAGSSSSSQ